MTMSTYAIGPGNIANAAVEAGRAIARSLFLFVLCLIASLWAQRQGAAAQKDPVTLSPASLSFAAQTVGSTSAAQAVALTNNQATALNISSIAASGDFGIAPTGTCGASLASGK